MYPHFELYPAVPGSSSLIATAPIKRTRARKTHSEIVGAVLAKGESEVSSAVKVKLAKPRTIVPRLRIVTQPSRARKTHAQIVEKVMAERQTQAPLPNVTVQEPEWEMMAPTPPPSRPVVVKRPDGPRIRPAELEFRRSVSLNRAASDRPIVSQRLESEPGTGVARSSSLRQLPSVREGRPSPLSRSGSPRDTQRIASKRDSLVLEKARMWGSQSSRPAPPPLETPSTRLTMNELDEFPLPPVPQASNFPTIARPAGGRPPVSKLDRSKFPFQ